jgi:hypothetical protein
MMASAGYVIYDPASGLFTLRQEHIPVLAQEGSPLFYGRVHQMLMGLVKPIDQLVQAFQYGGVPPSAFHPFVTSPECQSPAALSPLLSPQVVLLFV